jgi:hypothetical protein
VLCSFAVLGKVALFGTVSSKLFLSVSVQDFKSMLVWPRSSLKVR